MKTVWKFPLYLKDRQVIEMPLGARVLHVDVQDQVLCLWAEVTPSTQPHERRIFWIVGTGNEMPGGLLRHLGSVFMRRPGDLAKHRPFVWHVYEETG